MAKPSLLSRLIYSLSNGFEINTSLVYNLLCCGHLGEGSVGGERKTPALSVIVNNFFAVKHLNAE